MEDIKDFDNEKTVINVVSNKVEDHAEGKLVFSKLTLVAEKFLNMKLKFLGYIPNDANVTKAVMQQKPVSMVYENSKASVAFKLLAQNLMNDSEEEKKNRTGIAQVFLNIFRLKSGK